MATTDPRSAEAEHTHHRYVTNRIPWYVHLLWVSFWVFGLLYLLRFAIPAMQRELVAPP
ncbi:MAG: hypothetical protein NZ700_06605 [Gemmataceae bacterium]|nr:hypothetical protein [Gemmataceae bacterium]MDW8267018.1 hypothetical protein [Gemmataceae bacterium]